MCVQRHLQPIVPSLSFPHRFLMDERKIEKPGALSLQKPGNQCLDLGRPCYSIREVLGVSFFGPPFNSLCEIGLLVVPCIMIKLIMTLHPRTPSTPSNSMFARKGWPHQVDRRRRSLLGLAPRETLMVRQKVEKFVRDRGRNRAA